MSRGPLSGIHVIVAGAGLAGLAAAHALARTGARVTVVEARNRVGGRVHTSRRGFAARQHAEAGGDIIEPGQTAVLALAREIRLQTVPILKQGFGYYGPTASGRLAVQVLERTMAPVARELARLVDLYRLSEQRWDTAIAMTLGRMSVAEWLARVKAPAWTLARFRGLRGLFLADPEELSLLALIDFLATDPFDDDAGPARRIVGGNDRLATTIARSLRRRPLLETVLRRVRQRDDRVVATVDGPGGRAEIEADYLVCTLPAGTLRDVSFEPALPETQAQAIRSLRYGPATRVLLQFERRFWTKAGRPNAFGSDRPHGAVWDGNEEQRGPAAILSVLAGGGASSELSAILSDEGIAGLVERLAWLGRPTALLQSHVVRWEEDPWARGGYAVFDTTFDPRLRDLLARPFGRVLFAGEHTHIRWQGYMNGAVESGQRAATEIELLHLCQFSRRS